MPLPSSSVLYMVAGAAIIWSSWVRRHTWPLYWERPANFMLIALLAGLVTGNHLLGGWLIEPLHSFFGVWGLGNLFSHVCRIAAAGAFAELTVRWVLERQYARQYITNWVSIPGSCAVIFMIYAFWAGGAYKVRGGPYFPNVPVESWVNAYQIIFALTMLAILAVAIRPLLVLWRERRHRTIAGLYLFSAAAAAILFTNILIVQLTPFSLIGETHGDIAFTIGVTVFAVTSGWSWKRKLRSASHAHDGEYDSLRESQQ